MNKMTRLFTRDKCLKNVILSQRGLDCHTRESSFYLKHSTMSQEGGGEEIGKSSSDHNTQMQLQRRNYETKGKKLEKRQVKFEELNATHNHTNS